MNRTPLYTQSVAHAYEANEMEAYWKSRDANIACRDAIKKAIAENYHDYRLDTKAAEQVLRDFGYERTAYVLATTIVHCTGDQRISRGNMEWARNIQPVDDSANSYMRLDAHTGLVDLFVDCVRDEQRIKLPLYKHSADYAREHDELDRWRDSRKANVLCAEAIEKTLNAKWDGMNLAPDAASEIIRKFGKERTVHVVASTVQLYRDDDRISNGNKSWAATIPMRDNEESRSGYKISGHPVKLNDLANLTRQELAKERKPSVRRKLSETPEVPSTPKPRKRSKLEER